MTPVDRPRYPGMGPSLRQMAEAFSRLGGGPKTLTDMTYLDLCAWREASQARSQRLRTARAQRTHARIAALATLGIVILVAWGIGLLVGQYLIP